jgi:glycosyltransferase
MRISIITVAYNSAATLIDGGSTDDTLAKLAPYRDRIAQLVSEPDGGMYDAMNKGIARASGDVVAILNSDDVYADTEVLALVVDIFGKGGLNTSTNSGQGSEPAPGGRTLLSADSDGGPDVVYGDLHYVSPDLKRVVRNWKSGDYQYGQFQRGWHPPHPSFFVRREVYKKLGGFKTELRIAADYEFMLRVLHKNRCSVHYLPEVLVKMRTGGASNRSALNVLKANFECYQAWRMNGFGALTAGTAVLRKPFSKLKQLRGA